MADIKISNLLPASTPLNGTETLPIVQSGNTVKASAQDIASLYSLGYTAENVANKSTDTSFAGATDLKYPSQLAVKTYVDNTLNNTGWKLSGNSGTTSANFIGTIDAQDFVIKTENAEQLRFKATGGSGNIETGYDFYSKNSGGSSIYAQSTSGNGFAALSHNTTDKGFLALSNGSFRSDLKVNNITSNRALQLPDTTGTLVATVNGTAPDPSGNVVVTASADYLVYTALISYTGTVNVIVLKNTIGVSFAWTNPSNGLARITATSGTPFTTGKTWISNGCANIGGTPYLVTGDLAGNIIVNFRFFLHDGTLLSTPSFTNYPIEIRVYP